MSQTRLNGRQTRWLIKLLPYDFHIFYRKGALNPADGPSRRPDYLDGAEEIDDTPVTRLLPSLRERVATRDLHGNYEGTTGTESLRDSQSERGPFGAMESQHHLAASSGAGSKNQDLVGVNEGKGPVRTQEVLAGDDVADNDLSWLRLQAATREQARRATKGISSGSVPAAEDAVPDGNIFSESTKHQQKCKSFTGSRDHPGASGLRSRNVPSHGPGLTRGRPGPIPGMTGNSSQPVDNLNLY
jgi:hypothetical protein